VPEGREVLENERQILATTTLVTHRRVKWTREGLPNKSSLKAFARGLGPDEARMESLLLQAYRADLFVETTEGHIDPDVPRIRRASSHGLSRPEESLIGAVEARLPAEGWISVGALTPHFRHYGVSADRDLMARCAGQFVFNEHRGELFLARPVRPTLRTGDGHVTPSFEVLLGPAAHPEILVTVGLFAELTRLDRVLTFRITEASVVGGLRAGRPLEEFLDALAAVGRHGVPENVTITVKDFASRAAIIRALWALEVPASATDALMRELGAAAVSAPRPGLVLVTARVSERDVAAAMVRAGLKPVSMLDAPPAVDGVDERPEAPSPPPLREPDSALRDAVQREREGGFRSSYRAFENVYPRFQYVPGRDAEKTVQDAVAQMRANGAPPLVRKAFEMLGELIAGVPGELDEWAKRLLPHHAKAVRRAIANPVELVPFACLPDHARRDVSRRAVSWSTLVRLSEACLLQGQIRNDGPRLLATLAPIIGALAPTEEDGPDPFSERIRPGPAFASAVRALVEDEEVMMVATRSKGTPLRTHNVAPTSLIRRGSELVLLAEDLDTEDNHAFPLSKIEWIEVDRQPTIAAIEEPAIEGSPAPVIDLFPSAARTERNDPCPCGSGKKYKKCHGVTN
jgi:hypothetical protein